MNNVIYSLPPNTKAGGWTTAPSQKEPRFYPPVPNERHKDGIKWMAKLQATDETYIYHRPRDLPGDALAINYFMQKDFCAKLQQIVENCNAVLFLYKSIAWNPQLQTQISSCVLHQPTPVKAPWREVFEDIAYNFAISWAPNQTNHRTKDSHIS